MSKLRTGPIFTQDILDHLTKALQTEQSDAEQDDGVVFRDKTHSLQKFLHHGMSRFSIETLQHVLDSLVASNTTSDGGPISIRSLGDLRTMVKMTMMRREAGSLKASDAEALIYIENFFYAIYCMTEAKRLFDDVYGDLYYSYYNPDEISRQPTRIPSSKQGQNHQGGQVLEDYSQFGISTLEQLSGSTQHKLRHTVKDMQDILTRWSNLLTEDEPQEDSLEPESEQDVHQLRIPSRAKVVLRLLPDMFAKFYKSLELAKQWWVLAHEIYPDLPFQRRPSVSSSDQQSASVSSETNTDKLLEEIDELGHDERTMNIKNEILETKNAMKESNSAIKALQEELDVLAQREEKFEILMETYEKVGEDISQMTRDRQKLLSEKEHLSRSGDNQEIDLADQKLRHHDDNLRLLEFQHALLLQDYMIHLEIRPSIIRFQGEANLRLVDLQSQLEKQTDYIEKLERQLRGPDDPDDPEEQIKSVAWHSEVPDETHSEAESIDVKDESSDTAHTGLNSQDAQPNTIENTQLQNKKELLKKSNSKRDLALAAREEDDNEQDDNSRVRKQSFLTRKASVRTDDKDSVHKKNDVIAESEEKRTKRSENKKTDTTAKVQGRKESMSDSKSLSGEAEKVFTKVSLSPGDSKKSVVLAKSKSSKDIIGKRSDELEAASRRRSVSDLDIKKDDSNSKQINRRESLRSDISKPSTNTRSLHSKADLHTKRSSVPKLEENHSSNTTPQPKDKAIPHTTPSSHHEERTPQTKRNSVSGGKQDHVTKKSSVSEKKGKEGVEFTRRKLSEEKNGGDAGAKPASEVKKNGDKVLEAKKTKDTEAKTASKTRSGDVKSEMAREAKNNGDTGTKSTVEMKKTGDAGTKKRGEEKKPGDTGPNTQSGVKKSPDRGAKTPKEMKTTAEDPGAKRASESSISSGHRKRSVDATKAGGQSVNQRK